MQNKQAKTGGSNKVTAFLKRNIYYVLMILCVLAIGTMITVAAVVNNSGDKDTVGPPTNDPTDNPPVVKEFVLTMPYEGAVIAKYDPKAIVNNAARPHLAIDIAAAIGSKIVAPFDGVVTKAEKTDGSTPLYAMTVEIDHENGYTSVLRLLNNVNVTLNQKVTAGEVIGEVMTKEQGVFESHLESHVHYQLLHNGVAVDPTEFMADGNK